MAARSAHRGANGLKRRNGLKKRTVLRITAAIAWVIALALSALLLATPPDAEAHSELVGTQVERTPAGSHAIVLAFSERIDPGFARVTVSDEHGDRIEIDSVTVREDRLHIWAELSAVPEGRYTVAWFVRSQDGDTSNGSTRVRIGPGADPESLLPPVGARDPAWHPPMTWRMTSVSAMLRWLNYLGLLLAVGAVFFRISSWPAAERTAAARPRMPGFHELAFAGLATLFFANILLLLLQASYVQLATIQPIDSSSPIPLGQSDLTRARTVTAVGEILGTWSGWVWLARMGLLAALAVTVWRTPPAAPRKDPRLIGAAVAASLLLLTVSLTSHAAFVPEDMGLRAVAVGLDWTHLTAMAFWLGGLPPLLIAVLHFRKGGPEEQRAGTKLVRRFSPLALASVVYLAVTGIAASYFQVGDPLLLVRTAYGITLDVKLGLVGMLVLLGAFNRYRLIPGLTNSSGLSGLNGFARSLPVELALGALLLLSVGMLASLGAAATTWPAHKALGVAQSETREDTELTLRIAPGEEGTNAVAVDVTDTRGGAWQKPGRVNVAVGPADSAAYGEPSSGSSTRRLSTDRRATENMRTERYIVPELVDLTAGRLSVHVTLSRDGYATIEESFAARVDPSSE